MLNRSESKHKTENQKIVESRIGRYIRGEISATCLVNCPWRKTYKKHIERGATIDCHVMNRQRAAANTTAADKIKLKVRPPFRNAINVKNTSFVSMVDDLKRLKLDDSKSSIRSGLKLLNKPSKIAAAKEDKYHHSTTTMQRKVYVPGNDYKMNESAKKHTAADIRKPILTAFNDKFCQIAGPTSSTNRLRHSKQIPYSIDDLCHGSEMCRCLADPDVDSFCMCKEDALKKIIPEPGLYMKEIRKKLNTVKNRSAKTKSVVSPVLSFYSSNNEEPENFEYWQCN